MSAREDYIIDRIDRSKESPQAKAMRTRRAMHLRMLARRTVDTMLRDLEPEEQAIILRDALDVAGERLHPILGRVEAATAFNAVASDICAHLKLPRAIAAARAEQLFTKAATDGGRE
jgi:hypothetical protein